LYKLVIFITLVIFTYTYLGTTSRNSTTPSPNPANQIQKPSKRQKSLQNSENDSSSAEAETGGGDSMVDTEGEGPSEPLMLNEIELVFKPHPTEMAGDNSLIKALKENSIRYIKTTANATGEIFCKCVIKGKKLYIYLKKLIIL